MRIRVILASVLSVLIVAGGAFAAAFIKFDGIDGESKAKDMPMESISLNFEKITYSHIDARVGMPLVVEDERGMQKTLARDGRYSTSLGEKIWVEDGRVVKSTVMQHKMDVKQGDDGTAKGLLLPAVQKVRESAAQGSSSSSSSGSTSSKKKGNVEYGWKVEEGSK